MLLLRDARKPRLSPSRRYVLQCDVFASGCRFRFYQSRLLCRLAIVKKALVGRPNLPVPLPIFRLRSKSPLPRSRRSPPPTSRCAPAPRVNALSQNPAIEALPSPRLFFSFPRLYPKALSPLSDLRPSSPPQIETAPFDPRFPQTNQAKHCYTRYNEFHKCVPLGGRRRHAHKSRCSLLVTKELCSNKYLSARSPTFSSLSQVQSAEG